jgi:hypothetical protein
MVKLGRAHAVQLVRLLSALLAWASVAAFSPGTALAGPLEGVTRPVEGAVGAPVEEVTETVTGAVPEVTETVTPPVEEAVEQVSPPVKEVTESVTHPPKEATAKLPPPVKKATGKLPSPVKGTAGGRAATSAGGAVHETAGAANQGVRTAGGGVRSADRAAPSPTDGTAAGALGAAPTDAIGSRGPGRPSTSARPDLGPGTDSFEVPSRGGAVRAPLPKWMAYVWPAIALVRPALADLISRRERQGLLLAVGGTETGYAVAGEGPVVAGVHAHGGRSEVPDSSSSSSPFPQIPSPIGQALTSESPTPLLAYLCLVAIAVVAIFWAVSREIVGGRRRDQ